MAFLPLRKLKDKARSIFGVLALGALVFAAIYGDRGFVQLRHLRAEQQKLEHTTFDLQQRNERLRQRIERLRNDDLYIEKLARERLGMAHGDELIYRVLPTPTVGMMKDE